ncbi:MAG: PEP-CTERM sorting domain-containing protein [Halieaceae bacterium]|jgi:hypothetical protein|nr:PEP-CTERM sorting domain-containing protein [Halieaceae bacterium]
MNNRNKILANGFAGAILAATVSGGAGAAAIIDNGTIQLGVDTAGQLNVPGSVPSPYAFTTEVGLRHLPTGLEATSHGCLCEGWGVGIADASGTRVTSGYANNSSGGVIGLTEVSFTSTADTAQSVVELASGELRVTHSFAPSTDTPNLYEVSVDIENISGADIADLRYTRLFDWDVEPTTFDEYVSIFGAGAASAVLYANDDGFQSGDPFGSRAPLVAGAEGDFVDSGPDDHGALFDFGFGGLAAGETFSFSIFYGAARTEADANAALAAAGIEVASFGQSSIDQFGNGRGRLPGFDTPVETATFIFGFTGVGGDVIVPDPGDVPVPATLALVGLGMIGLGFIRRRPRA